MYVPIEWVLFGIYLIVLVFFLWDSPWTRMRDRVRDIRRGYALSFGHKSKPSPLVYRDELLSMFGPFIWPVLLPIFWAWRAWRAVTR